MVGDNFRLVKETVPIAEVIGSLVPLIPAGREFKCVCPFHDDHHPSMSVVPHKGLFHCFVCGAGGDAITFMQKYHGLPAGDALKLLADNFGIKLAGQLSERRDPSLYDALEQAARYFESNLTGSPAEDYLVDRRGLNRDTMGEFRLGYAPDSWDVPLQLSSGFDSKVLEEVGLVGRSEKNSSRVYNFFRNRLIFPIRDQAGRVIAFAGRSLNDTDEPKYLNSRDSPLYAKSGVFFGISEATKAIRERKSLNIFEGYVDVVSAHQAGIANSIATAGTALTDEHVRILERRFPNLEIILGFDGDDAGKKAAFRASEKILGRLNAKVALFPEGEDPASIIESGGDLQLGLTTCSQPLSEFYLAELSKGRELNSPEGVASLLNDLAPALRGVPSSAQDIYIEAVHQRTGITPQAIRTHVFGLDWRIRNGEGRSRAYWEAELIRQLATASSGDINAHIGKSLRPEDFSVLEARALYLWMQRNSPEQQGLFAGGEAPLFKPQELGKVVDSIVDDYWGRGVMLNRGTLSQLLSGNGSRPRVALSDIERSVMMVRAYSLVGSLNTAGERGVHYADVEPVFEELQKVIEPYHGGK